MSDGFLCPKCGNSGINIITGEPCDCGFNAQTFYDAVSCLDIPEQYRGTRFSSFLVPKDVDESYSKFLEDTHFSITAGKWVNKNLIIASPIAHSKTIFAYSCIEALFRNGVDVFPIYDVLELHRIIVDMDMGKNCVYAVGEPQRMLTVPVLFVKVPRVSKWEVYDCISLLVDRRVRRGNSTIFLYDGSWQHLINGDRNEILSGMMGDGTYGTIEVKTWNLIQSKKEIILEENLG